VTNGTDGDPTIIQSLLDSPYSPRQRLRSADRTRLATARTIVDSSYADIVEFIDGDLPDDPYFVVAVDDDVQATAFEAYKLLHHYLAALYSFNGAIRATITAYLPNSVALTRERLTPDNTGSRVEYARRLLFLRGLRIAAQHGAFNDCFPVEQWNPSSNRYRIAFDTMAFTQHDRLQNPSQYLAHSNENWQREPLRYIGSFHTTNFHPFYRDCLAWFETY
jgi:hypothetical protein